MRYRPLAPSLPEVSEIGFGVWTVGTTWWGVTDPGVGIRLLREAHERGVNFYDTANVYGKGLGETILAEAFGPKIKDLVVATKFAYDFEKTEERKGHGELPQDWSPAFIRASCEASLKRLGRDWIDVYQLHNPRIEAIRSSEILETLEGLKKEGKIREYAAALGPDIGWLEEGRAAIEETGYPILQVIYNLLEQDPTKDLLPLADRRGTRLIVRVPHASGLLDASYNPKKHFEKSDHRSHRKELWMQAGLEAVEHLKGILSPERTMAQSALAFCLKPDSVATVLPNLTRPEQFDEFLRLADTPSLSLKEMEKIGRFWALFAERLKQPLADSQSKPTPRAAAV